MKRKIGLGLLAFTFLVKSKLLYILLGSSVAKLYEVMDKEYFGIPLYLILMLISLALLSYAYYKKEL